MPDVPTLEFFDDPAAFLRAAGPLLTEQPVLGSVIASFTERIARELDEGEDSWAEVGADFTRWWLVVREGDRVVSAVMRTAPFSPYPTFALPLSEPAARLVAATLHDRGERLGGSNGALPGSRTLAEETARLGGGRVVVKQATRLWEAIEVDVPPAPAGRLRRATTDDADLVREWYAAFHAEADEQAGRSPDPHAGDHVTLASVLVRIHEGIEWLWELPDGELAHLSSASLAAYGVSRVGPVFTPRPHRGGGIASHVVGELTRRGLAAGSRMCLFTDQANPTSNQIYARLGYRPVTEMADHLVALDSGRHD